jgi:vancomycin resistance protein VanJ
MPFWGEPIAEGWASDSGSMKSGSLRRFAESATKWMTLGYVAGFVVLLVLLLWWGERNWLLGLILFAPAPLLLLPLVVLAPFCAVFQPRLLLPQAACVLLLVFGYMTFRWRAPEARTAGALTVVTHNIGQGNRKQFMEFLAANQPELIVLQDARNRGGDYARAFQDRHVQGAGEFYLISKHPIRRADLLQEPNRNGRPVAARFEVVRGNVPLVVYNVHLPTPRRHLGKFLSGRALADVVADEGRERRKRREFPRVAGCTRGTRATALECLREGEATIHRMRRLQHAGPWIYLQDPWKRHGRCPRGGGNRIWLHVPRGRS